jgi:hypothetical protein
MEFTDLQMTLTVVVVLTAAAALVWFDYLRKQRQPQQLQRIKLVKTPPLPPQRSKKIFDASPLDYAPAKKLAAERSVEPLVGIATASRPPVQPRERETLTVEMAPPSPPAPSSSTEGQPPPANHAGLNTQPFTLPPFTIDAVLWERLISSQPKRNLLPSAEVEPEPIDKTPNLHAPTQQDTDKPRGMIQQPVLEQMLESEAPFTGLVVSIGINDSDSSMWHSSGLMQSVGNYIASLLRENEFSCRTAYDEFVMVCGGEQGAQSQRRLNHISERLWDFQLRGIGACSILFSWGGVQVQDRLLAEAVASATERMRQTKRSGPSAKSAQAHRKAV